MVRFARPPTRLLLRRPPATPSQPTRPPSRRRERHLIPCSARVSVNLTHNSRNRTISPLPRRRAPTRRPARLLSFLPNPLAAMRTCIMLAEPRLHTLFMEPVRAWQPRNLIVKLHLIHADTARRLAVVAQHLLRHLNGRQVSQGLGGRGAGRVARRVLLHQLADDAVQRFLRVDGVAVLRGGWVEHSVEERADGVEGCCTAGHGHGPTAGGTGGPAEAIHA